ncbi:Rv3235 family protein [Haloglycomyces albus]|uniref:Rv3235 family protein n=1 Tax=Haloglycomyces albus TaxID=526067 RepID=UPI00046CC95C|nr:Rv3235 family protein [Haloglycomyces albus]
MSVYAMTTPFIDQPFEDGPPPREAVAIAAYILDIITGKRPARGCRRYVTNQGWDSLQYLGRLIEGPMKGIRMLRQYCTEPGVAEFLWRFSIGERRMAAIMHIRQIGLRWMLTEIRVIDHAGRHRR